MAYSDYGAFVYKNGERRLDKEDVALFATDEETFGTSSENIPSGSRIFASLIHAKESGKLSNWETTIHHGIMGDGDIRVMCHKQGLPQIYEATEDGVEEIKYHDDEVSFFEYDPIDFEYNGYKFYFEATRPYFASMVEPDGTKWVCYYDYGYGAGF